MVTRLKKKLYPRSFLASAALDRSIGKEAAKRGMTRSQLIRLAITEWLLYQGVEDAKKLRQVK